MGEVYSIKGHKITDENVHLPPDDNDMVGLCAPVDSVVEALENLLEKAQNGEIISLVAVYVYSDNATGGVLSGSRSFSLVGRMEDVKREILDELD